LNGTAQCPCNPYSSIYLIKDMNDYLVLKALKLRMVLVFAAMVLISACAYDVTDEASLLKKCRDKQSIVGFSVTYQLLNDLETRHYKDTFDDQLSNMERVDFCECFVSKATRLPEQDKQQLYARISDTDRRLSEELKIFSQKGLIGKLSYGDQYQAMYDASLAIPNLKTLMSQTSKDKLVHEQCRI
ncbi:MAG: hypothetical protein ACPGPF_04500, partial [Pontibacterium sp.]